MDNVLILIDDSKFNHGCGDTHLSASASMNAWSPGCVRPHYAAGVTGACRRGLRGGDADGCPAEDPDPACPTPGDTVVA
jgi:hypothetical protein